MAERVVTIIIIGESAVGKTSLLLRFTDDFFSVKTELSLGVDSKCKRCKIGDIPVKLKIRDTAGQERYRSLTSTTYRGVQGVMLAYDITSESTFDNLKYWIEDIKKYTAADVNIILVGNKSDEPPEYRQVNPETAKEFAKSQNIPHFLETSAKTADHVQQAFELLTKEILQCKERKNNESMKQRTADSKEKGGCC